MKIPRAEDRKLKIKTDGVLSELTKTLGAEPAQIRPLNLTPLPTAPTESSAPAVIVRTVNDDGLRLRTSEGDISYMEGALISLSFLIVMLAFFGGVFVCCMLATFIPYLEIFNRLYEAPRGYEPVFVEPSRKDYDAQVIETSISLDDEGGGTHQDHHLSFTMQDIEGISFTGDQRDGRSSEFGGPSTNHDHSFSKGGSSMEERRTSVGYRSVTDRKTSSGPSALEGQDDPGAPADNTFSKDTEQKDELPGSKRKDDSDEKVLIVETHHPPYKTKYAAENTTEL